MTLNSSDQLFESLSAMVDNEASELEIHRILRSLDHSSDVLDRWRRYHLIGSVMRRECSIPELNSEKLLASVSGAINGIKSNYIANTDSKVSDSGTGTILTETPDKPMENNQVIGTTSRSGVFKEFVGKSAIAASFAATLVMGFHFLGGSGMANDNTAGQQLAAPPGDFKPATVEPTPVVAHAPIGFELPLPEARTVSMANSASASTGDIRTQMPIYVDDITDFATQDLLNQLLIQHAERASAHGSLGIMPFARVHKMQIDHQAR